MSQSRNEYGIRPLHEDNENTLKHTIEGVLRPGPATPFSSQPKKLVRNRGAVYSNVLSICAWNVESLKNKIVDKDFLELL